jgi:hypothetical protein
MTDQNENPMDKCFSLDLVTLESNDGKNLTVCITNKNYSSYVSGDDGKIVYCLTQNCASEGELNYIVDNLEGELEILRKEGLKRLRREPYSDHRPGCIKRLECGMN